MEILGWSLLTVIIVGLIVVALPVIAFVDLVKREFSNFEKVVWAIVIIIIPILGSIIYLLVGRNRAWSGSSGSSTTTGTRR